MDAFDLFFVFGPTIQRIFHLGFLPQDGDFVELTNVERESYLRNNRQTTERIFRMNMPSNDGCTEGTVICLTESDKANLMSAVKFMEEYTRGKIFHDSEERLHYVAGRLPEVFSKGTRFEQKYNKGGV